MHCLQQQTKQITFFCFASLNLIENNPLVLQTKVGLGGAKHSFDFERANCYEALGCTQTLKTVLLGTGGPLS